MPDSGRSGASGDMLRAMTNSFASADLTRAASGVPGSYYYHVEVGTS